MACLRGETQMSEIADTFRRDLSQENGSDGNSSLRPEHCITTMDHTGEKSSAHATFLWKSDDGAFPVAAKIKQTMNAGGEITTILAQHEGKDYRQITGSGLSEISIENGLYRLTKEPDQSKDRFLYTKTRVDEKSDEYKKTMEALSKFDFENTASCLEVLKH